jgi:hypothetical protein
MSIDEQTVQRPFNRAKGRSSTLVLGDDPVLISAFIELCEGLQHPLDRRNIPESWRRFQAVRDQALSSTLDARFPLSLPSLRQRMENQKCVRPHYRRE